MMAKVVERPDSQLYDTDFSLWIERQIALLRGGRFDEIDIDHLIEEMEGLSRKEKQEVESRALLILVHLLKLSFSSASEPRRGWRRTVMVQRRSLDRMLTTTLRQHLSAQVYTLYQDARRLTAVELETDAVEPDVLPEACPYTLDEVLDAEWLPQNVHDLDRDGT